MPMNPLGLAPDVIEALLVRNACSGGIDLRSIIRSGSVDLVSLVPSVAYCSSKFLSASASIT